MKDIDCDKKYFERGNSIYVVGEGDTGEKAQENENFLEVISLQ